ncbi:hypothetical protein, partial [Serratia fonticola]
MGNAAGNETNGGGQGGTVVNLAAEPKVSGLKLSGPESFSPETFGSAARLTTVPPCPPPFASLPAALPMLVSTVTVLPDFDAPFLA